MLLKSVFMALAMLCLGSFTWGRRVFFVRSHQVTRLRSGLAPLGSIFGVVTLLAISFEPFDTPGELRVFVAGGLMVGSFILFWSAVRAFGSDRPRIAFSSEEPSCLVSSGPYGYVRHPFYVAYFLFWLGACLAVGTWWMISAPTVMGFLYRQAAAREERAILASPLGREYAEYMKRSGMFFPKMV